MGRVQTGGTNPRAEWTSAQISAVPRYLITSLGPYPDSSPGQGMSLLAETGTGGQRGHGLPSGRPICTGFAAVIPTAAAHIQSSDPHAARWAAQPCFQPDLNQSRPALSPREHLTSAARLWPRGAHPAPQRLPAAEPAALTARGRDPAPSSGSRRSGRCAPGSAAPSPPRRWRRRAAGRKARPSPPAPWASRCVPSRSPAAGTRAVTSRCPCRPPRRPRPRAHLGGFAQNGGGGFAQLQGQPRRQPLGRQVGLQLHERHGRFLRSALPRCPAPPSRSARPRSGPPLLRPSSPAAPRAQRGPREGTGMFYFNPGASAACAAFGAGSTMGREMMF